MSWDLHAWLKIFKMFIFAKKSRNSSKFKKKSNFEFAAIIYPSFLGSSKMIFGIEKCSRSLWTCKRGLKRSLKHFLKKGLEKVA